MGSGVVVRWRWRPWSWAPVMLSGGDDAAPGRRGRGRAGRPPAGRPDRARSRTRLDMVAETGATTTRVDVFWGDVAPSGARPTRRPGRPGVRLLARRPDHAGPRRSTGITPIVSVYNAPRVGDRRRDRAARRRSTRLAPDPEDFGDFMAALADALLRRLHLAGRRDPAGGAPLSRSGTSPTSRVLLAPVRGRRARVLASTPTPRWTGPPTRRSSRPNPDAIVIVGVGGPRSSTSRHRHRRHRLAAGPARARDPARRLLAARLPGGAAARRTPRSCRAGAPSAACWTSSTPGRPGPARSTSPRPATRRRPRPTATRQVTEDAAGRVPHPDLLPAPAAHRAGQDGRLVQPPGQRELAGRPAARGPVEEAELRAPSRRVVEDQDGARLGLTRAARRREAASEQRDAEQRGHHRAAEHADLGGGHERRVVERELGDEQRDGEPDARPARRRRRRGPSARPRGRLLRPSTDGEGRRPAVRPSGLADHQAERDGEPPRASRAAASSEAGSSTMPGVGEREDRQHDEARPLVQAVLHPGQRARSPRARARPGAAIRRRRRRGPRGGRRSPRRCAPPRR